MAKMSKSMLRGHMVFPCQTVPCHKGTYMAKEPLYTYAKPILVLVCARSIGKCVGGKALVPSTQVSGKPWTRLPRRARRRASHRYRPWSLSGEQEMTCTVRVDIVDAHGSISHGTAELLPTGRSLPNSLRSSIEGSSTQWTRSSSCEGIP